MLDPKKPGDLAERVPLQHSVTTLVTASEPKAC